MFDFFKKGFQLHLLPDLLSKGAEEMEAKFKVLEDRIETLEKAIIHGDTIVQEDNTHVN